MRAGHLYQQTRDLDIAEIARLIRRDIKTSRADPDSPVPPEATVRVRIHRYSLGQSLSVTVEGMPDTWVYASREPDPDYGDGRLGGARTAACEGTIESLNQIIRAYNYDDSDPQSDHHDVRFYSHVTVRAERSTAT